MPRETLSISGDVLAHLRDLGVTIPPFAGELTTDAYFDFWRSVSSGAARPDLGLSLGVAVFGLSTSSQAALQAPTLGDALRTIGRYKRLSCPEDVLVEIANGEARVRCDWVRATGEVPPVLVDAIFASHVKLAAHGTGGKAMPVRIELARKRRHDRTLRDHFGCSIAFGATHDRIVFPESALALPMVTANRAAYAHFVPGLEAQLLATRSVLGEARVAIARTISAGARPSLESIAARLDVSARTLQRRLGEESTSFQDQLDDVRRIVARRLLAHTDLPPIDIAFLLGFAEPNSFARAFRSWERTTPLRWRDARG